MSSRVGTSARAMSSVSSKRSGQEQDDIEYNLSFPASGQEIGEFEPVVFFFGWVGAKDKVLAKYSALYEKEGCVTIRYIHPFNSIFSRDPSDSEDLRIAAVKLVQLLEDYDLRDNPVFVHVLSNGGYFVYRYFADLLQKNDVNIAGAIFDSCPAKLEFLVGARAVLNSGILPNKFMSFLFIVAFSLFSVFIWLKTSLGLAKKSHLFEYMKTSTVHTWPHLFLYSTADVIVPLKHVEEMMTARKIAGSLFVDDHNFESSPHVLHLKNHPDVYKRKCMDFVQKCLQIYDEETDITEKFSECGEQQQAEDDRI